MTFPLRRARIYASAEWFDKVPTYDVMQPAPFVSQQPRDTIDLTLQQTLNDVFNWSVGVEYVFSGTVTGYASFYTDRSAPCLPTSPRTSPSAAGISL